MARLGARATANFAQTPHVRVVHGDGTRIVFEPVDIIYVNAGATRPADAWLDRLKEGGRLILPLTADGFPNRDVGAGSCVASSGAVRNFLRAGSPGSRSFPVRAVVTRAGEQALVAGLRQGRRRARDPAVPARRFAGRPMLAARAGLVS